MKWLVLVCFLLSFNPNAQEGRCPTDESLAIDNLEQEFNDCAVVDYGKDEWQTSEMLKAYDRSIDCMQKVAHHLFDKYYTHYNASVKKNFDNYVSAATDISFDINQRSDMGRSIRLAEVYVLEAAGRTHVMVKNLVKDYIKEIKITSKKYAMSVMTHMNLTTNPNHIV